MGTNPDNARNRLRNYPVSTKSTRVKSHVKCTSSDLAIRHLGELYSSNTQFTFTYRHSNVKRSHRNDKSYLLHPPCTKTHCHGQDTVLVKHQSTINSIIVLENHLHVNHAPPHTTLLVVISLTWRNFLRRCNSTWQQLATHV